MGPRIVTLTLNPALDLASTAELVRPTHKIRTVGEHVDPGGGGINVARVVRMLGGEALAVLLAGGATGQYVGELLDEAGVARLSVPTRGRTRISFTVFEAASGLEYRFVPEGPEIAEAEWRAALEAVETVETDWVVASGSLPRGAPTDIYAEIARRAARRGRRFVLDTSGPPLAAALGHGITLLKPSLGELEALLGRKLADPRAQEAEALALVQSGAARMVALSLGREGAILASEAGVRRMAAPTVAVRSAVGAGDSFLAGLTLALARGETEEHALAWGIAAGVAALGSFGTARLDRAEVEAGYRALLPQG
jgi:6-phosphofructokinase 2